MQRGLHYFADIIAYVVVVVVVVGGDLRKSARFAGG